MSSLALGIDRVVGLLSHALHVRGAKQNTTGDLEQYLGLDKETLFPLPAPLRRVDRRPAFAPWDDEGTTTETLSWESGHVPLSPAYAVRHRTEYRCNLTASARWTFPKAGPRKRALVYVHGWLAPGPWVEAALVLPRFAEALTVDTVHVQLPFHGSRKPWNSLFHGEFYWTGDLVRSVESIRQSIYDVRSVVGWLRSAGYEEIGVTGISLGGSLTMLTACLDAPPDYIVPIVGHLQLANTVEAAGILWRIKSDLERFGVDEAQRRHIFRELGLDEMRPILAPSRQLWIMAKDDGYILRADVEAQWRAWGEPRIEWIPGGHMTFPLSLPRMEEAMRTFHSGLPTPR